MTVKSSGEIRLNSLRSNYRNQVPEIPFVHHAYRWKEISLFLIADEDVQDSVGEMILEETAPLLLTFNQRTSSRVDRFPPFHHMIPSSVFHFLARSSVSFFFSLYTKLSRIIHPHTSRMSHNIFYYFQLNWMRYVTFAQYASAVRLARFFSTTPSIIPCSQYTSYCGFDIGFDACRRLHCVVYTVN